MAGQDDSGDKTEKPTPKKLQDARKKGEVSKSKDLTATATLLTVLLLATVALPMVGQQMTSLIELSLRGLQVPFPEALAQLGWQALRTLLLLVGLVVVTDAAVGVLVEFLQTGPVRAGEARGRGISSLARQLDAAGVGHGRVSPGVGAGPGMATLQLHEEDAHEHARHTPGNEGRRRRPASQGPSQATAAGVGSARRQQGGSQRPCAGGQSHPCRDCHRLPS